jgi:Transposase DDE domain group 1
MVGSFGDCCARGEGPHDHRAAEKGNQFASPHPGTSAQTTNQRRLETSICGRIPVAIAAQRPRRDELAMNEDILLPFDLPAVRRKKVSAAFDGGRITADGGVMLLAQAERRLGIADRLAREIPDERDADRIVHLLNDILRDRIFAIACGYEDADDLDRLRFDPALKLACGRLPDTGRDLCSQPTVSRWENAPSRRRVIHVGAGERV